MNTRKNGFFAKAARFFDGKGFYIVLLLCISVIGVSAWAIWSGGLEPEESAAGGLPETADTVFPDDSEYEEASLPYEQSEYLPEETAEYVEDDLRDDVDDPGAVIDVAGQGQTERDTAEPVSRPEPLSFVWPVSGDISLPFSVSELVYNKTMGDWRTHAAIDIAAEIGTTVMAAASGTVQSVYSDDMYGTTVTIDHGDELVSLYANLAAMPTVSEGDKVVAGDIIGAVGSTSIAETGDVTHIHFAMFKNGSPIDPEDYLP